MIKVKTLVFCEKRYEYGDVHEMFTSHHSTMSFMSARCHRFLDITSTFRGVNASLLKDTTGRG